MFVWDCACNSECVEDGFKGKYDDDCECQIDPDDFSDIVCLPPGTGHSIKFLFYYNDSPKSATFFVAFAWRFFKNNLNMIFEFRQLLTTVCPHLFSQSDEPKYLHLGIFTWEGSAILAMGHTKSVTVLFFFNPNVV